MREYTAANKCHQSILVRLADALVRLRPIGKINCSTICDTGLCKWKIG